MTVLTKLVNHKTTFNFPEETKPTLKHNLSSKRSSGPPFISNNKIIINLIVLLRHTTMYSNRI